MERRGAFLRIFSFKRLAESLEGRAHADGEGVLEDGFFVVHDDFVLVGVVLLKDLQLRVGQLCGEGTVVPRDKSLQFLNGGCLRSVIGVVLMLPYQGMKTIVKAINVPQMTL